MPRAQRAKGQRIEHEIVTRHTTLGIPAAKTSRSGYAGHDVLIAEHFTGEVKARKDGSGFKQLEAWLRDADVLFLRRNHAPPLVAMPWAVYAELLHAWCKQETYSEEH